MSVLCLEESKTKLNCVGIRNVCKQTFAIFEKKQFETWSAAEIAGLIGVTSRRIYDILIICTLLEIVEHSGEKGKYRWNGISELGEVLKRFHKDVLKKQSSLNISSEHDIRLYKTNENEQGEDTMLAICKFILELFLISSVFFSLPFFSYFHLFPYFLYFFKILIVFFFSYITSAEFIHWKNVCSFDEVFRSRTNHFIIHRYGRNKCDVCMKHLIF